MVHDDQLRKEFAERLKTAAADAEISEWGLGARLSEVTGKTPKAASKWINHETMPGRANMLAIAKALGVRVQWLQYGELPKRESDGRITASTPSPEPLNHYRAALIDEAKTADIKLVQYALSIINGTIKPQAAPDEAAAGIAAKLAAERFSALDKSIDEYYGAKSEDERRQIKVKIGGQIVEMRDRRRQTADPPDGKLKRGSDRK